MNFIHDCRFDPDERNFWVSDLNWHEYDSWVYILNDRVNLHTISRAAKRMISPLDDIFFLWFYLKITKNTIHSLFPLLFFLLSPCLLFQKGFKWLQKGVPLHQFVCLVDFFDDINAHLQRDHAFGLQGIFVHFHLRADVGHSVEPIMCIYDVNFILFVHQGDDGDALYEFGPHF